jgi:hypothetical protein
MTSPSARSRPDDRQVFGPQLDALGQQFRQPPVERAFASAVRPADRVTLTITNWSVRSISR